MNDHQVRDEVMTLLLGSGMKANCRYCLPGHGTVCLERPQSRVACMRELSSVPARQRAEVQRFPCLLPYAMVLQEVLRLYPPVWILSRKALADDELGGMSIPQGSMVIVSPYADTSSTQPSCGAAGGIRIRSVLRPNE